MNSKIKGTCAAVLAGSLILAAIGPTVAAEKRRVSSDYEVTPQKENGVIRAFYYGSSTIVELETPPRSVSVVDEIGRTLETEVEGRFIKLVDRAPIFTLAYSGKAATFRSREELAKIKHPPVQIDPTPTIPVAWIEKEKAASGEKAAEPAAVKPAPVVQSQQQAKAPEKAITATPAAAPSPPAVPAKESKVEPQKTTGKAWRILATDDSLSQTLKRWANEAGWGVSWETRDFPVLFTPTYYGTFEEVVQQFVLGLSESDAPVMAELREDGTNRLVRIIKYEGNSKDAN